MSQSHSEHLSSAPTNPRLRPVDPIVWPNTAQYKRALQRPDIVFNDPELKTARMDRDIMGTPAAVEGQSAVVFFGQTDNGRVTVRCLKRPVAHGERRYAALHTYLAERPTAPMAAVEWQSNGIVVDSAPWPIVRMEQVGGISMRQYVSRCLYIGTELEVLSSRWRDLTEDLRRHKIAHGDLQQDNVRILDDGVLRLIDLDGVWAPPLASMPPREYGHRHFQHPERLRIGHWDDGVDAFSALVIYISLRALAVDPTLWDEYHNDENLILADSDFENPGTTPIWSRLAASRDLEVRDLVPMLNQFCKQTVRIETDLPTILRTRTLPGGTVYVLSGVPLQRSAWWADPAGQAGGSDPTVEWLSPSQHVGGASGQSRPASVVDQWPHAALAKAASQVGPVSAASTRDMRRRRALLVLAILLAVLVIAVIGVAASG